MSLSRRGHHTADKSQLSYAHVLRPSHLKYPHAGPVPPSAAPCEERDSSPALLTLRLALLSVVCSKG